MQRIKRYARRGLGSLAGWGLLLVIATVPAHGRTIVLDFWSDPSTDIYGFSTGSFQSSGFGFSSLSHDQVIGSLFTAVEYDFMGIGYSSLPAGRQLDVDFELGTIGMAPTNGDSNYAYMQIGDSIGSPSSSSFGHACVGCGLFGNGTVVGSVFTDNLAAYAYLASSDDQLINLIAGTLAHEIAHTLSLVHPDGTGANPGESPYSLMGVGSPPTYMPNGERVRDRAFSYDEFDQLIAAVGLRDAAVTVVPVSSTLLLMLVGGLALRMTRANPRAPSPALLPEPIPAGH